MHFRTLRDSNPSCASPSFEKHPPFPLYILGHGSEQLIRLARTWVARRLASIRFTWAFSLCSASVLHVRHANWPCVPSLSLSICKFPTEDCAASLPPLMYMHCVVSELHDLRNPDRSNPDPRRLAHRLSTGHRARRGWLSPSTGGPFPQIPVAKVLLMASS